MEAENPKILTVLLNAIGEVNTAKKIEKIILSCRNFDRQNCVIPLWEWREHYEIMKKQPFADLINQLFDKENPIPKKHMEYNVKYLYNLAKETNPEFLSQYEINFEEKNPEKQNKLTFEEKKEQFRTTDEYAEWKKQFELNHFQHNDQFYIIQKNSLKQFSFYGFNVKYGEFKKFLQSWYEDPERRQFNNIDFIPNENDCPADTFNTWGMLKLTQPENNNADTSVIHQFLKYICGCEDHTYEYLIKFLSHAIKYPEVKPQIGILLTSEQGSGKDTFVELLKLLFCEETISFENDPENVFGKYNMTARFNKIFVVLQEADNLKSWTGKIKDCITSKTASLADKCVKSRAVRDYTRLVVFSNNENIVKVEQKDRRWVIIKAWNMAFEKKAQSFFLELYKQLFKPEVIAKFKYELMNQDVDKYYNFQANRPQTIIYDDIKKANTPNLIKWAYYISNEYPNKTFYATELTDLYNTWIKTQYENSHQINNQSFGLNIKKYFYINNEWIGFVKKNQSKGSSYLITENIRTIIKETYNFIGDDF